jgi:5-methylcytosine-specific restriction endonuclease McrA
LRFATANIFIWGIHIARLGKPNSITSGRHPEIEGAEPSRATSLRQGYGWQANSRRLGPPKRNARRRLYDTGGPGAIPGGATTLAISVKNKHHRRVAAFGRTRPYELNLICCALPRRSNEKFMSDILNTTIVLVLNRNWQAINIRTPQEAFCMMASNVATALDIEIEDASELRTPHSEFRASAMRPVTWNEWITLPVREQDYAVNTVHRAVRVPTVIVAVNFAKVPKKRPKLCAKNIRERDGNRCQYTGKLLKLDEGSLDHVLPRSRGGADSWENLVWSSKDVNTRKGNRLPHEAGLKLLSIPRAPKELPVTALIRNAHGVAEWKLFLNDKA